MYKWNCSSVCQPKLNHWASVLQPIILWGFVIQTSSLATMYFMLDGYKLWISQFLHALLSHFHKETRDQNAKSPQTRKPTIYSNSNSWSGSQNFNSHISPRMRFLISTCIFRVAVQQQLSYSRIIPVIIYVSNKSNSNLSFDTPNLLQLLKLISCLPSA